MALSIPPDSFSPREVIQGYEEIPEGFLHRFEELELKDHVLKLALHDGTPIVTLRRNLPGNGHSAFDIDVTYSLIFPYGDEVLLPYPQNPDTRCRLIIGTEQFAAYLTSIKKVAPEQMVIQVGFDGAVTISALPAENGTAYKVEPESDPDESIHSVYPEAIEFSEKARDIAMEPDMVLCLYDMDGRHLGSVFQTAGTERGYVITNHDYSRILTLNVDEYQAKKIEIVDGNTCAFRNLGSSIGITSEKPVHGSLVVIGARDHIPPGEDGCLKGFINGPSHFYAITGKKAGKVKPGYGLVDEDSVAFCRKTGRMVVADGLGGYGNGQHASALAARRIADFKGSLEHGIHSAANALEVLNTYLPKSSDTVFAGAELHGNRADFFSTGDARWYLVHGGKVVKQNKVRTVLEDILRVDKSRTRAEVYADKPDYKSVVTTTLRSTLNDSESQKAEIEYNIPVPKGAYIVLTSDGCSLTQEEIAECVEGRAPLDGCELIRARQAEINRSGKKCPVDYGDGKGPAEVSAPRDHFTCLVYRQEY